jgi:predicted DsbA family dithiol-disulfide isomerase
MRIDFISDVVCPWCAIGLHALEAAARRIDGLTLELHFHPFELNPGMGAEGQDIDEHLQQKYGGPAEQFAASREAIRRRGEELGFAFNMGARSRIYNSFDAHRLLHLAGTLDAGLQRRLKGELFKAYFSEGRNISDPAELLAVAAVAGMPPVETRAVLESNRYADDVRAAEQEWQRLGISSVPAVILDQRLLVPGGQPVDVFEQALRQAMQTPASGA